MRKNYETQQLIVLFLYIVAFMLRVRLFRHGLHLRSFLSTLALISLIELDQSQKLFVLHLTVRVNVNDAEHIDQPIFIELIGHFAGTISND